MQILLIVLFQKGSISWKNERILSIVGTRNPKYRDVDFCKQLIDLEHTEAVLLDSYTNPIKVELKEFYEEILSRWFEVTNDYYVEYEKLRKARKVHKVIDLNEKGE